VLSAASGVSTLIAPSVWLQYCQTASSEARAAAAHGHGRARTPRRHDRALRRAGRRSRVLAIFKREGDLDGCARVHGAACAAGERRPRHRGRLPERAVAADELRAIARDEAARIVHMEERRARGEFAL